MKTWNITGDELDTAKKVVLVDKPNNTLALAQAIVGIYKPAGVKVTIELCARVALLVCCITSHPTFPTLIYTQRFILGRNVLHSDYWAAVDKELANVRKECAGDAAKISRYVYQILSSSSGTFNGTFTE